MPDGFKYTWTPLEITECSRCDRPLLRESLPILRCVATFDPVEDAMQEFEKNLNLGQAHQFPPRLADNFFPLRVEFEHKESKLLCFRCTMEFEAWWEMSESAVKEYDMVDELNAERRR